MDPKLKEIISKILFLPPEKVTEDLGREEVEDWDSMTHLVLVSEIEKEYSIAFSDEEVVAIESVSDIIDLLKSSLAS